jgi:hypothetical protein
MCDAQQQNVTPRHNMIQNVLFEYEDDEKPSKEREILFTKSLQMWLRPFGDEINKQNGTLVLIFSSDGANSFRLEGVEDALRESIVRQFPQFIAP